MSKDEDIMGDITLKDVLVEVPPTYWHCPVVYLLLIYLPDKGYWVTKWGHTDVGIYKRIRSLNSEYDVHLDRPFCDQSTCITRIIPLVLVAAERSGRKHHVPSVMETAMKLRLNCYSEPIKRKMTVKTESGTDHAAIYDTFLALITEIGAKKVFESERCLVDPDFIDYDEIRISEVPSEEETSEEEETFD